MIYQAITLLKSIVRNEKGLTAVEYAVLGGIIVAAIGVAAASFQGNLSAAFNSMFDSV